MAVTDNIRQRVKRLLTDPEKEMDRWAKFVRFQIHLWHYCARRLWTNNLTAMASALSFRTIFAMVPALVLVFLLLKAMGVLEDGKQSLRRLLDASGFAQIALVPEDGSSSTQGASTAETEPARVINIAGEIETLVGRVESKLTISRLGPVGVVLLIWTALTLLTEMEQALNRIFGASRGRSTIRRMLLYWSVMTLGPLILAAAVYLGREAIDVFAEVPGLSWLVAAVGHIGPVIAGIFVLAAVYKLLSYADVGFRSALAGSVVAVPLWLVAKWAFALYIRKFVATGNLYGGLGLVPLFLVWLNVSWLIFLFGAELARAASNVNELRTEEGPDHAASGPADLLAAAIAIARSYLAGRGSVSASEVAAKLGLSGESVHVILGRLEALGLVCAVEGHPHGAYILAKPAGRIPVLAILGMDAPPGAATTDRYDAEVASGMARMRDQAKSALGFVTLADLVSDGG